MVVSAGVKSILDIGLTLEYLETQVRWLNTHCSTELKGVPIGVSNQGHRLTDSVAKSELVEAGTFWP